MDSKFLIFVFRGNISQRVLENIDLSGVVKRLVHGVDDIHDLVREVGVAHCTYVLGLGMYARKSEEYLRVETTCTNWFRRKPDKLETLTMFPFISTSGIYRYGSKVGNSYCNKVSYEIMHMLITKGLQTKYAFIHIPKNFDTKLTASTITKSLRDLMSLERSVDRD